jgi:CelD/BcsL family acetyltransferase involved in cellulose biosynthesis
VLCSETEGLSNAVLEYMACGLPVVATDVGGNPDLVVPGETGFLYPPGDVAALAAHLDALLGDDALRARMGAAATARFRDRFGLARMVRETVAVYDRVLRGEPVGREARPEAVEGPATARPGGPQVAAVAAVAADGGRAGLASPSPAGRPFAGSIETVTDLARAEALAPAWAALVGDRQFFLTPTWVTTWLRWAAPAVTPHVLVARDGGGAVVGVLPLARRGRMLELAGAAEGADHLDVVAAPGRAPEVAEGFLAHLEALPPDGWARLVLRHVAEDGALRHAVRARRWRLPYREAMATVCPFVAVAGTYDDYLKRFSAKHRGNLRRRCGWREDPAVTVARVTDPAAAADAIDVVMALHAKRFGACGDGVRRRVDLAVAPRAGAGSRPRGGSIVTLRAGGVPVAAHYGFRFGGRLLHFQGGFDPAFRDRSPGTALTTMVLEDDVFGGGLTEYDFLDGDEAYKLSLSTGVRRLYDLVISRPTLPSRALSLTLGSLSLLRGTKGS